MAFLSPGRVAGLAVAVVIVEFTNALAIVAVIWYGGALVLGEEVTLGVLVAFLTYITRFFQPIRELTQFYNQLQAATAGGERVFELMDESVAVSEKVSGVLDVTGGAVKDGLSDCAPESVTVGPLVWVHW